LPDFWIFPGEQSELDVHASLGNRSNAEKRNGEWMSCKKVFPIDNRNILGMEDPPPPDVPFFTKDGKSIPRP